jgi:hypothetical protein
MNRRGFFGLLGKLLAVGTAMSVAPELLAPVKALTDDELCIEADKIDWAAYKDGPAFALAS